MRLHRLGPALLALALGATPARCTDLFGDALPEGAVARLGTGRFRHEPKIESIAFSPDGKTVATGGHRMVYLWDAATGKQLRSLQGNYYVLPLAFAPDGKTLAVGGAGGVTLWDVATGKVLRVCRGIQYSITALAMAPDGRTIAATAVLDKDVHLWDVETGRELRRLPAGVSQVASLAFTSDGKTLAGGSDARHVRFWDVNSGKETFPFPERSVWGESVAFSPDGKLLAAAGSTPAANKCSVGLWELATGKKLPHFGEDSRFGYSLAFSPGGKTLGVVGFDGILRLWDVGAGNFLHQLGGLPVGFTRGGGRYPLAFSPDGKTVASRSYHGNVLDIWDTAGGRRVNAFPAHDQPVADLICSPDGKTIASRGQHDTKVHLWEARTGKHLHTLRGHSSNVAALAFTPGSQTLISAGTAKDDLHRWQVASGKELPQIKAEIDQSFTSLAVCGNGKTLAAGTSLGSIFLWDLATAKLLLRFQAHPPIIDAAGEVEDYNPVTTLQFSPDGKTLASGSPLLMLSLWDVATGKLLRRFQESGTRLGGASLTYSPDGKTLTVLGREDKSFVWEVASGKKRREFRTPPIHKGSPGWSAFSADAQTVALCGYPSDTIHIWDLLRGVELGRKKGHLARISAFTFLPGDGRLASASEDTTILIWEAISPKKADPPPPVNLSARQLDESWTALADEDAAKAFQALQTLTASPRQAVELVDQKLRPAAAPPHERLAPLIAALDSQRFDVRAKASRELESMGPLAEPELKKVLANPPSLEVRLRVERLLDRLLARVFTSDELRAWRALEVLEHIGSSEARQALHRLAQGAPGHFLTEEARLASKRLTGPTAQRDKTP